MREHAEALAAYEREKTEHESLPRVRTVHFMIPPGDWRREEELLIGKVYACLPHTRELWRIDIAHENVSGIDRPTRNLSYRLLIAASGCSATVRLPLFPADALTDWVEDRGFSLRLEMKQAAVARAALQARSSERA